MITYLIFTLFLAILSANAQPNDNNVDTRYFIGVYNNGEFPMPFNKCGRLVSANFPIWHKAVCIDEETAEYAFYFEDTCENAWVPSFRRLTGNPDAVNGNETVLTQTGQGTLFDFNCDEDRIDAYAEIEVTLGTCAPGNQTKLFAALSTCAANTGVGGDHESPQDFENIKVYCNDSVVEVQLYDTPFETVATCDAEDLDFVASAGPVCDFMWPHKSYDIYGRLVQCCDSEGKCDDNVNTDSIFPSESPTFFDYYAPSAEPTIDVYTPNTTRVDLPDLDCQAMFGDVCLECDQTGCAQCASGYRRMSAGTSETYVCVKESNEACDDNISVCVYENCGDGFENPYCATFTAWGCTECQSGYFKKSHDYPCVSCDTIPGCEVCSDFAGCDSCAPGMLKYWDPVCGINRCSHTCAYPQ